MSLCITKSNKFKHLESKFRYNPENLEPYKIIPYVSNLRKKKQQQQEIPKLELFQNPKRHSYQHSHHFTNMRAGMQVSISSKTILPGHDLKGAKPSPRDNHCVQNPSPRDKTGSQKPEPRDIKLENFTNVSINSDTI